MSADAFSLGSRITGRARTITESDIVSFAAITGDWHPQHVDAEWAAQSRFGERIAHGMLVVSYSIGLMGFDPERVVALRGIDSLTFKRPVAIGETIRVDAEVVDVRPVDHHLDLVELRWRVLGEDDRLAVRARVTIVHRKEGASRAPEAPGASHDEASSAVSNGAPDGLYGDRVLL
jgi:3-hydroxybutyryl-CoA dehydratase